MEKLELNHLVRILSYVPRESQPNVLLVSKSWYQALDQYIGVHAILGRGLPLKPHEQDVTLYNSPNILKSLGISTCEFIEFLNESETAPKLKRPELLRRIVFRNFVSAATFQSILNDRVTNLQILEIDHGALYHLEFSDIDFSLSHCETLTVTRSNGTHPRFERRRDLGFNIQSNYWIVHVNAAFLFTKRFPGLTRIEVTLSYLKALHQDITRALLTLLINHMDTLSCAEVILSKDCLVDTFSRHATKNFKMPDSIRYIPTTSKPNNKLRKLNLEFPVWNVQKSSGDWERWLGTLRALEILRMKGTFGQDSVEPVISQNAESIKTVALEWNYRSLDNEATTVDGDEDEDNQPDFIFNTMNCRIFKNCQNLTNLTLKGNWSFISAMDTKVEHVIGLTNTASIPKTLTRITVMNIPLDSESCRFFCLEFPVLETLKLRTIAGRVGLGVQLPVVGEMVKRKQLRKFKVDLGFGSDPIVPPEILSITKKSRYSNCYIKSYLYGNGDYKDVPEHGLDSDDEPEVPENIEDFL